jgi:hypothetical protein
MAVFKWREVHYGINCGRGLAPDRRERIRSGDPVFNLIEEYIVLTGFKEPEGFFG